MRAYLYGSVQSPIHKTSSFLKSVNASQVDGSEERPITLKIAGQDLSFKGEEFALHFALPNFYFHVSMAYAILRHNGLDLGKKDYLGSR